MTTADASTIVERPARRASAPRVVSGTDIRFAGMLVAIAVCFATVIIPLGVRDFGSLTIDFGPLGFTGTPIAAVLAWWLTPGVVRGSWRHAGLIGVLTGCAAAFLGVLEVAYLSLIAALAGLDPSTGFGDDATGALFIAVYGLAFGWVALPVTVPCAVAWAFVTRGVLRRIPAVAEAPSPFGAWHVAVLLFVIAVGATLLPIVQARM